MTKEEIETMFTGSTIKDRQCIATLRHKIKEYKKQINNKEKALARVKRENESLVDMNALHEFFYEGCGFYKKGLNNSIMIADYIDKLEAQIEKMKNYQNCENFGTKECEKGNGYCICENWKLIGGK